MRVHVRRVSVCYSGACPTKYRIDQIRSNSNFAWNSYRCAFEDSRPIITKFGTRHDSRTVVTCTKFRYDRPTIIEIRGTRIFSKFWIRSNLSIRYLVGQAPGPDYQYFVFFTPITISVLFNHNYKFYCWGVYVNAISFCTTDLCFLKQYIFGSAIAHHPGCFCSWIFIYNIGWTFYHRITLCQMCILN